MDLHTSCLSTRGSVLAEGDVTVRLTCRDLHRRSRRARRPRREPRRDVARSDTTQGPTYPGDGGTTSASIHNRPPLSPPSPHPCLCSLSGRGLALAHSRGSACVCARGSHTHTHTHTTHTTPHIAPHLSYVYVSNAPRLVSLPTTARDSKRPSCARGGVRDFTVVHSRGSADIGEREGCLLSNNWRT